ncbi:MAG: hypothetical protein PHC64_11235 [Candidatus Gastranaerophilales bacterium]|nr:hypothetical protein [Candidatus Gastranaerophilales bacterium]
MWKFIFIVLFVLLIWKFYPVILGFDTEKAKQDTVHDIKYEKTIFKVNETREKLNKDALDALNK